MRKSVIAVLCGLCIVTFSSCSPRDFLTRRLAADLIATSSVFAAPQKFQLRTGVVSNKDYLSSEYLALLHRGWISSVNAACPSGTAPPPCWDIELTPAGVDTFQSLIAPGDAEKQTLSIPAARRELVAITGIAKQGNAAEVEFAWKWAPMSEVGAALYPENVRYHSTAEFRYFDDGWRLVEKLRNPAESLEDSLKNAEASR